MLPSSQPSPPSLIVSLCVLQYTDATEITTRSEVVSAAVLGESCDCHVTCHVTVT